jgi:hypothetical protein
MKNKNVNLPEKVLIEDIYKFEHYEDKSRLHLFFSKVEEHTKPIICLIIPCDYVSPIQYPLETIEIIENALTLLNIDPNNVDFYLDYKVMFPEKHHFMNVLYEISSKGKLMKDSYKEDLRVDKIPEVVAAIRSSYYNPTKRYGSMV